MGIGVLVIQKMFFPTISDKTLMKYYFILAPVILIGAMLINIVYVRKLMKKFDALRPLVKEDPERYIQEVQTLLRTIKSPQIREVIKVNIGAAYGNMENYQKSIEVLETVQKKYLIGINRTVYDMNLAYMCFNAGKLEEGARLVKNIPSDFFERAKVDELKALIKINEIYTHIADQEEERAKKELQNHRKLIEKSGDEKDIRKLELLLACPSGGR